MTPLARPYALQAATLFGRAWTRLLTSPSAPPCPFACTYCFANFSQYQSMNGLEQLIEDPSQFPSADFLYPDCDNEFFVTPGWRGWLQSLAKMSYSLSFSTKARLADSHVRLLAEANLSLRGRGQFLKVGVSIGRKHALSEVEPGAPRYEQRIDTLRKLAESGVPNALVLRPLLAEVDVAEYREIVADAAPYTRVMLIGDEWLDGEDPRVPASGMSKAQTSMHPVNWLPDRPSWGKRRVSGLAEALHDAAALQRIECFDSDLALMAKLSLRMAAP